MVFGYLVYSISLQICATSLNTQVSLYTRPTGVAAIGFSLMMKSSRFRLMLIMMMMMMIYVLRPLYFAHRPTSTGNEVKSKSRLMVIFLTSFKDDGSILAQMFQTILEDN